jgi:hypothetical protein
MNDLAPIVATVMVMLVPIAWILTAHQRKMAMIFHGSQQNPQNQQNSNNDALAAEVRELKQLVYQQAITLDAISTKLDKVATADVQNRLSGTQS